MRAGATGTVVTLLALQALIFISHGRGRARHGAGARARGGRRARRARARWLVLPPALLLALVLLLGVWIPDGLRQALAAAAAGIGGVAP